MATYNWYHGTPVDSSPAPDPAPAPDPVDVGVPTAPKDQGDSGRGDGRPVNIHKFSEGVVQKDGTYKRNFTVVNDLSNVKYSSLSDYLKAENLGDRSGFFSGTDFNQPYDSTKARAVEGAAGMFGPPLLAPFAASMFGDSQAILDPTGSANRYIPVSGAGNAIASMVIDQEYRDIYKIKNYRSNAANLGKDQGFIFNVGGKNIYRQPGSVTFRGQLDSAGIDQQGAKQLEVYSKGTAHGKTIANAILSGEGVTEEMISAIGNDRVILETTNGGYLLNGNFHYGTGTAAGGNMEDLDAVAMSMFSANGELSLEQAKVFASSWRNSAKGMAGFSGRNATTQELINNLKAFQEQARNYASELTTKKERINTIQQAVTGGRDVYTGDRAAEGREKVKDFAFTASTDDDNFQTATQTGSEVAGRTGSAEAGRYAGMAEAYGYSGGRSEPSYNEADGPGRDSSEEEEKEGRQDGPYMAEGGEVPGDDFDALIAGNEMIQSEGDESGFVGRPPSQVTDAESVADDKEMVAKEEGMVLNAEAVKLAGEQDVAAMMKEADDYLRKNGEEIEDTRESTNIRISEGEVYISPRHADVIGRSRLRKINDRGVPKTEKKLQKAAKGGRIGYAEGDEVQGFIDQPGEIADTGDAPRMKAEIPQGDIDLFKQFAAIKGQPKRAAVEGLIDNLSDVGKLALLIVTETTALADPLESMEAVGQVAVNRMNTNDPDFDDVDSIVDVLKQRSNRGTGSKMFQFDGLEPSTVKARAKDLTGNVGPMALDKIYSAARNVIDMNPRLGGDNVDGREPAIPLSVLYYKKPGSTGGNFMDERHFFEPYTTIGGHQFYNVNFEFPGKASGRIRYK